MECEHKYNYVGLVYYAGDHIPGSGAKAMLYADKYFCEKCLDVQYKNERRRGDTYTKPIAGSLPR